MREMMIQLLTSPSPSPSPMDDLIHIEGPDLSERGGMFLVLGLILVGVAVAALWKRK